jgi:hypothetical protein
VGFSAQRHRQTLMLRHRTAEGGKLVSQEHDESVGQPKDAEAFWLSMEPTMTVMESAWEEHWAAYHDLADTVREAKRTLSDDEFTRFREMLPDTVEAKEWLEDL